MVNRHPTSHEIVTFAFGPGQFLWGIFLPTGGRLMMDEWKPGGEHNALAELSEL